MDAEDEHDEAPADKEPGTMFAERDEYRAPSEASAWTPPRHRVIQLTKLRTTVPAPPWYNDARSHAISMPARIQENATCGLHAVNHLLACSSHPVVLQKHEFEQCGLQARVGDSPANLVDPASGNYDVAVLHKNLEAKNLSVLPMTAADIEGRPGQASLLPGSRLVEPFRDHVLPTGSHKALGYLLRVPVSGGHWITLLPGRVVTSTSSATSVLCDSLYPRPFLLEQEETQQLLQACAIDAEAGESHSSTGFVCFLIAQPERAVQCEALAAIEEAQLQTALAASLLDVGASHEVRPRLPSSRGLTLHEGWRAVGWVGVV